MPAARARAPARADAAQLHRAGRGAGAARGRRRRAAAARRRATAQEHELRRPAGGAERVNGSLLCVGLDPDPARFPGAWQRRRGAHLRLLRRHRRCHASDLVIAFKPQIAYFAAHRAEEQLERLIALHPRRRARRAGDPRRQARRHRLDRRAVRARGLRPLPGRRGDAVAASRLRLDRALPALRRQGRDPAVPHLQSRRRRPAGRCASSRGEQALRAHRPARRRRVEPTAASSASSSAPPTRPRSRACARSRRRCRC